MSDPSPTDDQSAALRQIEEAERPGQQYLLTGGPGTGKTWLMQRYAKSAKSRRKSIVLSAPTHKAVAVLRRKLVEAGIEDVDCRTIHSLLSLKPKVHGDRKLFERSKCADPVTADIVVIDECSMLDEALMRNIKRYLPVSFVLFVGDPAQLPPVGERESLSFHTARKTHLTTIVRQAAGNPIIAAASMIRESQGHAADWSWCVKAALDNGHGIFTPNGTAHAWMEKAFTSPAFDADPDSFRYLAWTNQRVHDVNRLVRRWRYGERIPTPFMPGERAMFRAPVIVNQTMLFSTNEEATVLSIDADVTSVQVPSAYSVPGWTATVSVWRIVLRDDAGTEKVVNLPANTAEWKRFLDRFRDEAVEDRIRWKHMHDFQSQFGEMQSIYALTSHVSQGSTFGLVFVDLPDIRRRERTDLLEMQKLCYVATTRASQRVILIGV